MAEKSITEYTPKWMLQGRLKQVDPQAYEYMHFDEPLVRLRERLEHDA